MKISSIFKELTGQEFSKITHKPENVKLVFIASGQGLVYDPENLISPHPVLLEKFAYQISKLFLNGRVAEYNGKTIVQFYGTYPSLTLVERELMKKAIKDMLLKGFVTGDAYIVDGADTVIGTVNEIVAKKER